MPDSAATSCQPVCQPGERGHRRQPPIVTSRDGETQVMETIQRNRGDLAPPGVGGAPCIGCPVGRKVLRIQARWFGRSAECEPQACHWGRCPEGTVGSYQHFSTSGPGVQEVRIPLLTSGSRLERRQRKRVADPTLRLALG